MSSKERSKTKQRKKTQLQKVLKDYQDGIYFVPNPNVVMKMAKHQQLILFPTLNIFLSLLPDPFCSSPYLFPRPFSLPHANILPYLHFFPPFSLHNALVTFFHAISHL